jgi:hypothetical protein
VDVGALDFVDNDVGKISKYYFSGVKYPARSASAGIFTKKFNSMKNGVLQLVGCHWVLLSEIVSVGYEVSSGWARPSDTHYWV